MRIININNNNYNNIQRIRIKTYLELFIHIIIIFPLLLFFYFLQRSKNNSYNSKSHSDIKISNTTYNNKLNFRSLTKIFQGVYNKDLTLKKIQYEDIVNKLIKKKYYGKWYTNTSKNEKKLIIGEAISGLATIKFIKDYQIITKEDTLAISINNYENNYIDHWLNHSSYIISRYLQLIPDKLNNNFILKGKWQTELEYGELFQTKISRRIPCSTEFSFVFQKKNVSYAVKVLDGNNYTVNFETIDENNFEINLNSDCGFNMTMEMSSEEGNNIYYSKAKEKKEVLKYFFGILILCIINYINNSIMIKDLASNKEAVNCIPLFCICFNINWHFYCCVTHISWSFTYKEYYYEFTTIGLLYMLTIIFCDSQFSCFVWSLLQNKS